MSSSFKNIFNNCSKIKSVAGIFLNTNVSGNVSNLLFDRCRNNLSNTSYAFCHTNINLIEVGKAKINYPEAVTERYVLYLQSLFDTNIKYFSHKENPENQTFYEKYIYSSTNTEYFTVFKDDVMSMSSYDEDVDITLIDSDDKVIITIFGRKKYIKSFFNTNLKDMPLFSSITNADDFYNKIESNALTPDLKNVLVSLNFISSNDSDDCYELYLMNIYLSNTKVNQYGNKINSKFFNCYTAAAFELFKEDVNVLLDSGSWTPESSFGISGLLNKLDYANSNSIVEVIEAGLLSDCGKLKTAEAMFANCIELEGSIPADMFFGNLELSNLQSLSNLFRHCHKLTTYNANLATTLKSTIYEDVEVEGIEVEEDDINLGGGNYQTVYPKINTDLTTNKRNIGLGKKQVYFVPENWLNRCKNITNISGMFCGVGTPRQVGENKTLSKEFITTDLDTEYYLNALILPNLLFSEHKSIKTASSAFREISTIGYSEIDNNFLSASKNQLTSIDFIFKFSKLYKISTSNTNCAFQFSGKNNILSNASSAFEAVNRLGIFTKDYVKEVTDEDALKNGVSILTNKYKFRFMNLLSSYNDQYGTNYDNLIDDHRYMTLMKERGLPTASYGPQFYNEEYFSNRLDCTKSLELTNVLPYYDLDSEATADAKVMLAEGISSSSTRGAVLDPANSGSYFISAAIYKLITDANATSKVSVQNLLASFNSYDLNSLNITYQSIDYDSLTRS